MSNKPEGWIRQRRPISDDPSSMATSQVLSSKFAVLSTSKASPALLLTFLGFVLWDQ